MYEEILRIRIPEPESEIITLETSSGHRFTIEILNKFKAIGEISKRARSHPVLVESRVKVQTPEGEWVSNKKIKVLITHGRRQTLGKHIVTPLNLDSYEVTQAVVKYLEQTQQGRLKIYIGCDRTLIRRTRWDQDERGAQLGVVGFSCMLNSVTTEAATQSLIVEIPDGIGVHPFSISKTGANKWMTTGEFVFLPKNGRISIAGRGRTTRDRIREFLNW